MGQIVLFALVVAALLSIIYGRSTGRKFMNGVFALIGAFILFIVLTGVGIYFLDKKQAAEARAAKDRPSPMPRPSTIPASTPTPPPAATYQAQPHQCSACQGSGTVVCTTCQGTGYSYRARQSMGGMPPPPDCPTCGMGSLGGAGTGRAYCPSCRGTGQVWY
jgi:hypothetical protein